MPRIPFSIPDSPPSSLILTGQDAIHVHRVLRMQIGEKLLLFDGKGKEYESIITAIDDHGIHLKLEAMIHIPAPPVHLDIAMALLKEKKNDELIRPLCELGVRTIRIFVAQRSIPILKPDKVKTRVERWQRLASEALKQCGSGHMPEILFHDSITPLLSSEAETEMRILFWENTENSIWPGENVSSGRIRAVFGPEGGFEQKEVLAFLEAGYQVLGLGPRILKAPTAILAGSALLQFRFGDLSQPPALPFSEMKEKKAL